MAHTAHTAYTYIMGTHSDRSAQVCSMHVFVYLCIHHTHSLMREEREKWKWLDVVVTQTWEREHHEIGWIDSTAESVVKMNKTQASQTATHIYGIHYTHTLPSTVYSTLYSLPAMRKWEMYWWVNESCEVRSATESNHWFSCVSYGSFIAISPLSFTPSLAFVRCSPRRIHSRVNVRISERSKKNQLQQQKVMKKERRTETVVSCICGTVNCEWTQ